MPKPLLKVNPAGDEPAEFEHDLAYYLSLTTARRFRMIIERSILLRRLAEHHAADREAPPLSKRV